MTVMAQEAFAEYDGVEFDSQIMEAPARPVSSGAVADFVAFRTPEAPRIERPALSRREVEVLLAWLAADSKEDAAAELFISVSTVSTHISRIRNKYANVDRPAPSKAHLLARALQDGYTTLAEW